jgi:hypothetical protein
MHRNQKMADEVPNDDPAPKKRKADEMEEDTPEEESSSLKVEGESVKNADDAEKETTSGEAAPTNDKDAETKKDETTDDSHREGKEDKKDDDGKDTNKDDDKMDSDVDNNDETKKETSEDEEKDEPATGEEKKSEEKDEAPPTQKKIPTKNPYDALKWIVVDNDGRPQSLIKLVALKSLFAKQLPKMPRTYIARLVFDRRHTSLAILSEDPALKDTDEEVIGSICYRAFPEMRFAEIAFCAVNASHQVKVRKLNYCTCFRPSRRSCIFSLCMSLSFCRATAQS